MLQNTVRVFSQREHSGISWKRKSLVKQPRSRILGDDGTQESREESAAIVIEAYEWKAIPVAYVSDFSYEAFRK
ncbi:hypothetical protein HZH66_014541 [Vespula vulgaris]|uniref:Uncharacterized protein n=1 Tax=Vespula vulgaris TaxID=7454 RepID=A0A834J2Z1_VESVU|nr:hypothetical protein HZH66_014541 [Vespula vulgaris]